MDELEKQTTQEGLKIDIIDGLEYKTDIIDGLELLKRTS
jgi:hypothetical protein